METESGGRSLLRTQPSKTSINSHKRSHRSPSTNRTSPSRRSNRKNSSYLSSSNSSIMDEDTKSLTSFPSLNIESPKQSDTFHHLTSNDNITDTSAAHHLTSNDAITDTARRISAPTPSIVQSLVSNLPAQSGRNALFDDLTPSKIPGSLHMASDDHIKRLIARSGAVTLLRQFAEDLAQRDAQIALLRRKAEERERALKKMLLECGLSNMDLEKRLRIIEAKHNNDLNIHDAANAPLEDLLTTVMSDSQAEDIQAEGTIARQGQTVRNKDAQKGWFNIWGGTAKKPANSTISEEYGSATVVPNKMNGRRSVLKDDIFAMPDPSPSRKTSRTADIGTAKPPPLERKTSASFAAMALRMVVGNPRNETVSRGRASSVTEQTRAPSTASNRTTSSSKSTPYPSTDIQNTRRKTVAVPTPSTPNNRTGADRWDTMVASPQSHTSNLENYGPVEMDAILPPETQPPTVTQVRNNNQWNPEFLTDRYGFIYDQRRKRRQKEAVESMDKTRRGNKLEMLSNGARGNMSHLIHDDDNDQHASIQRPDTPVSLEETEAPKKWQDFLKITTIAGTELLSHTPFSSAPSMEVMEGDSTPSTSAITSEGRGFVPVAHTVTPTKPSGIVDNATISKPANAVMDDTLTEEDVEPVKVLLEQLSEVHDALQESREHKWNEFLRKVRAERRREGEAAALASASDTRSKRAMAVMPEVNLFDGEMIGVAGLGIKGKVGRAKATEFKHLVLGGIPITMRARIWLEASGALDIRIPGYYEDLIARQPESDDPIIVSQIQMDINRTLTDNIFFRRGLGVTKLAEVLLAYSRRNVEVGYCQGMNLITGCLLLIMPTTEDAFWTLCAIVEKILPQGYYDHSLLASRADQIVLRQYVREILPRLSAHLDELSIELEALTFQWFLSVFTDCLSAEALFRVWDMVLCLPGEGSTFLFQVALALLKLNEPQLLRCDGPASVYLYINHQMTNHAISIDGLIQASEGLRRFVKREEVEARRKKAVKEEGDMARQREAKNNLRKKGKLPAAIVVAEETTRDDNVTQIEEEISSRRSSQTDFGVDDDFGELTVRTPMPVDEEVSLSLG